MPLYAVLGLMSGLVAVMIARGLFSAERWFRSLRVPVFWHPLIGVVGFVIIGFLVPRSLGVGYNVVDDVLAGQLALGTLAVLLAAKMLSWWIALGSGTSGGTLAPVPLMGASFGGLFAAVALGIAPDLGISQGAFAVVGMAAVFGAATGAPLTAMVFVFEITRDFEVLTPLMLATVLSALVFNVMSDESIYTEKLPRRGIRVGNELVADSLRTTAVADVMSRVVDSVSTDDTIGHVSDRIRNGEHGAFPVLDPDGTYVGMVTRRDLLINDYDNDAPVVDIASADMVQLGPEASLVDAMQLMAQEEVAHVPVIQRGKLVGICTRADIVRSRSDEMALKRLEPGWLAPVVQRRDREGKQLLIVGNESLGGEALMAEIASQIRSNPSVRFHVVVPLSAGGDLTGARKRLKTQLQLIEDLHASASGEIGRADPQGAIEVALRRQPAAGIILSTLPPSRSRWLRSNVPSGVSRRLDLGCVTVHDPDRAADE